ncbi:sulfotransferase family 2 domain-containing protein [Parvularcula lutaonensis]|uniref:Sulfotransferase family 2 domain-containing protein n=1 Tax=Parvularcula lutaonensis TaxID=491923 RepID=A0ABV7MFD7_9PROT|nr:sulfotransferase family 2 domain-containing protein [Parvularcula lutaonensis]GGY54001.1 hypothetical protein GCM10007148_24310 [Parvularcula lutaonensis]
MAIINHTWKFIFVHIPKCGGTTVSHALEPLCTWRDLVLGGTEFGEVCQVAYQKRFNISKHSRSNEIRSVVGAALWERYSTFSIVRHPVARTISTFRYLKHHADTYQFIEEFDTIEDFVLSDQWSKSGPDRMFLPQHTWTHSPSGSLLVDRFIKLEQIQSGLLDFLEKTGIPPNKISKIQLGHKNKMPYDPEDLAPDVVKAIQSKYKDDLALFGYWDWTSGGN